MVKLNTRFAFDASKSSDKEDPVDKLQVRWDFDGDEKWDTNWSTTKKTTHKYDNGAVYTVKLEVKDTKGLTNQTTQKLSVSKSTNLTGSFIDPQDGNTYKTIKIGDQTWMAENLQYKTQNSWYYNNAPANGTLYSWNDAKTACPKGWHLPTDDEWKILGMHLGMSQSEADTKGWRGTDKGKKMKSKTGWLDNSNGNDLSGFDAKPRGQCTPDGSGGIIYNFFFKNAYFWSASESSNDHA